MKLCVFVCVCVRACVCLEQVNFWTKLYEGSRYLKREYLLIKELKYLIKMLMNIVYKNMIYEW